VCIGPASSAQSTEYAAIISAAEVTIRWPSSGLRLPVGERRFRRAGRKERLSIFIGPKQTIRLMGDKVSAISSCAAEVPAFRSDGALSDRSETTAHRARYRLPVIIKLRARVGAEWRGHSRP